jgi:glycylpeptide N-tetradecanoyltransferase
VPPPPLFALTARQDASGAVTDVMSWYVLPSTIIGNDKYPTLNAAYAFYNVATSVPLAQLINDALILARKVPKRGDPR